MKQFFKVMLSTSVILLVMFVFIILMIFTVVKADALILEFINK